MKNFIVHPHIRGSLVLVAALVFISSMLDLFAPPIPSSTLLSWPVNLYLLGAASLTVGVLWIISHGKTITMLLASGHLALVSSVALSLISVVLGSLHLENLQKLTGSWSFVGILTLIWLNLGLTVWRRVLPFGERRRGYLTAHFGCWLALGAGMAGSTDLQRISMDTQQGEWTWWAREKGQLMEAPLALKLNNFTRDEFPPRIAMIDESEGKAVVHMDKPLIFELQTLLPKGDSSGPWVVFDQTLALRVIKYIPMAGPIGDRFEFANEDGLPPAALVEIRDDRGQTRQVWLSSGSYRLPPVAHTLSPRRTLALLEPQARAYRSHLELVVPGDSIIRTIVVEVNSPARIRTPSGTWLAYQLSYDEAMGKWSQSSVIELVRDPWIPWVYIGFGLMCLGCIPLARAPAEDGSTTGKNRRRSS